jgi:hypothetical protein
MEYYVVKYNTHWNGLLAASYSESSGSEYRQVMVVQVYTTTRISRIANVMYMSDIYANRSDCAVSSAVPVPWATLGVNHD